jgi:hypothetical protein
MVLGNNRAKAAYDYLRKKGIAASRMVTVLATVNDVRLPQTIALKTCSLTVVMSLLS